MGSLIRDYNPFNKSSIERWFGSTEEDILNQKEYLIQQGCKDHQIQTGFVFGDQVVCPWWIELDASKHQKGGGVTWQRRTQVDS